MNLHLLLDSRAVQKNVDGISRYALNVTRCILEKRPDWRVTAVMGESAAFHLEGTSAEVLKSNSMRFRKGPDARLARTINDIAPDVFLNFSMAGPKPAVPTIITVHDLMVLNLPCYFGENIIRNAISRMIFHRALSASMSHAAAIAVPTMVSKLDVLRRFSFTEGRIFISGEGQALFKPPYEDRMARKDFFLYVGNARGYKNIPRFLTAYGRLWAMDRSTPPLVMVVRQDRAWSHFRKHLDSNPARSSIKVLTCITDEELRKLYMTCRALLMPSVYEGFGLPALEAMACGTPVMASKATALQEVVDDTGVLIDPYSVIDIMRGIAELKTASREALETMGRRAMARASEFTWEKTADRFLARIESLV